jgi:RecA-family ATPase
MSNIDDPKTPDNPGMSFDEWVDRAPYGKRTREDGTEALFNSDYLVIFERQPGEEAKPAASAELVEFSADDVIFSDWDVFTPPTDADALAHMNGILNEWGQPSLPAAPPRAPDWYRDAFDDARPNPWLYPFGRAPELPADEDDGDEVRPETEADDPAYWHKLIPDAFAAAKTLREYGIDVRGRDLKPGTHIATCPSCGEDMDLRVEAKRIRWDCCYADGCSHSGGITAPRKIAGANVIPLLTMRRWDDEDAPRQEWAVGDRIPLGHVSLFSGEGGSGKSLILQQLGVSHTAGLEWFGAPVKRGPVLIFDAEDTENVIHKRLADILAHHGLRFRDVRRDLHVSSFAGKDAVMATFSHKAGTMQPTPIYDALVEMVGDLKPVLIGIASSADVFAGNEIDRGQVRQFIQLLTKLAMLAHGAVVLISHPSLSGISSGSGLSGSTAWHNSVRARFYLKGFTAKDEEGGGEPDTDLRQIEFKKNNYGPVSESITLRYRNGLFVPVTASDAEDEARRAEAEQIFLSLLSLLTTQNKQDLSPSKFAPNYAPAVMAAHDEAKKRKLGKLVLETAQQRLLDADKIHIKETGPASKRRKYLLPGPRTLL